MKTTGFVSQILQTGLLEVKVRSGSKVRRASPKVKFLPQERENPNLTPKPC